MENESKLPPASPQRYYKQMEYRGYTITVEASTHSGRVQEYEYTIHCGLDYVDWAHEFTTPDYALMAAKRFADGLTPMGYRRVLP